MVNRLVHYFGTYKMNVAGDGTNPIEVVGTYGHDEALDVVRAAMSDYDQHFRSHHPQ